MKKLLDTRRTSALVARRTPASFLPTQIAYAMTITPDIGAATCQMSVASAGRRRAALHAQAGIGPRDARGA